PERQPAHADAGRVLVVDEDFGDRLATRREQELVEVDERDPSSLAAMGAQTVVIGSELAWRHGPIHELDDALLDVRIDYLSMLVSAVVVVQEETLYSHEAMELDPF